MSTSQPNLRNVMREAIPIFKQQPDDARFKSVCSAFSDKYGQSATFVARAPGRVNIIGEHIDYAGLSVMPAAIDRNILIAGRSSFSTSSTGECRITVANVNPKFATETLTYLAGKEGPKLDPKAHSWVNYFKAGLKGVLGHLSDSYTGRVLKLDLMVDGNVPPAGGLSSSAAMVVSSAIAVLKAYDALDGVDQGQLAEIAIDSERLVGVSSGGMDQSASIFSRENHLLNVAFVPELAATLVPFPKQTPALTYIIANSLVVSEKQVTAKYNYNLRVVETRVATRLLERHLGLSLPQTHPTPKHVMDAYFGNAESNIPPPEDQQQQLQKMVEIVEEVFGGTPEGNDWDNVYKLLGGIDQAEFVQTFHPEFEIEADRLKLYKRIKHTYSEARRVYAYRQLLEQAQQVQGNVAQQLGDLMSDSQSSCRDLYECSCPEIDEICKIASQAGGYGSRLTGAGFGGCTVHLVSEVKRDQLMSALRTDYYEKHYPGLSDTDLNAALFATKPEEGACLFVLS